MTRLQAIGAAFVVVGNAIITMLITTGVAHWTDPQKAAAFVEVNVVVAMVIAIYAHFDPATSKEPVALASTFTALVTATLLLLVAFAIVHWTRAQVDTIVGTTTAVVALVTLLLARNSVTPVLPPAGAGRAVDVP